MIDRRAFVKGLAGAACAYPLRAAAAHTELELALENGRFWTGGPDGSTTDAIGIALCHAYSRSTRQAIAASAAKLERRP